MSSLHPYIRGFYHISQAWHGPSSIADCQKRDPSYVDEIILGLYCQDEEGVNQGCACECVIEWVVLGGLATPSIRLYDDAWRLFTEMPELFAALAKMDSQNPSIETVCEMLKGLGFKDLTQRVEIP